MTIISSTPDGITTEKPVRLLKNLTGASVMLELADNVIENVLPEQSLFYDNVVDSNITSDTYNLDKIQDLIDNSVLSDSTLTLTEPTPDIVFTSGGTFVAAVAANKAVKIATKEYNQHVNHLETIPVVDASNALIAIIYRDVEGISYSLNNGLSSVLISNDNLLYPGEITSVAVQLYSKCDDTIPKVKLFIGTLREGLKTFTIGVDTSYVQFVDLDCVCEKSTGVTKEDPNSVLPDGTIGKIAPDYRIEYLFRHSIKNIIKDSLATTYKYVDVNGETYDYISGDYAPVFVVSLSNFSRDNGCPLLVYSRTLVDGALKPKYCLKYLHDSVYTESINLYGQLNKTKCNLDTLLPTFTEAQYTTSGWILLQNDGKVVTDIGIPVLSSNAIDFFSPISCLRNDLYVNATSKDLIRSIEYSFLLSGFINVFYTVSWQTPSSPSIVVLPDPPKELLTSPTVSGCSYFRDPATLLETYFVTAVDSVWKFEANIWTKFIYKTATGYYSTGVNSILRFSDTATTYLTSLKTFSVASVPDSSTEYLGYLGSLSGLIQYNLVCRNGSLQIKDSSLVKARTIRQDLSNSYVSNLVVPSGTNLVFTCSLVNTIPVRYDDNSSSIYLDITPNVDDDINTTFIRSNYSVFNEPTTEYYNKTNAYQLSYLPSDQILDLTSNMLDRVSVKLYLDSTLDSSEYLTKFCYFMSDPKLYVHLNRSFGKYVRLYIIQACSKTLSVGSYSYTLVGTKNYYVPIMATTIKLKDAFGAYFVDNYIESGYTIEL